ncbi:hypothetical protein DOTSEDRAFT_26162 [Dothistroma septosporum NZE10]|uniref:Uncharacterized protein n=1 Tax=Dothistroma septosporum (strain NZE10 / CBS 128990) TaxID=675120 RepID=N1PKF0_DOTSN|nr:hypothetical protein DOTSEDRAFT_26162 [Dothistroma septosporum NZE10]
MARSLSISGVVSFFLLSSTAIAMPLLDLQDWTRLRHKSLAHAPFPSLKPNATEGTPPRHTLTTYPCTGTVPYPTRHFPTAPCPIAAAPTSHYNIKRSPEDRYAPPPPYLPSGYSTETGTALPNPTGTGSPQPEHHQHHQANQFGGARQHQFEPCFPFTPPEAGHPGVKPTPTASEIFPSGTAPPSPTGYRDVI